MLQSENLFTLTSPENLFEISAICGLKIVESME